MKVAKWMVTLLMAIVGSGAFAQEITSLPPAPEAVNLDAVLVAGRFPAPGLWELTRGNKTLLIMGTLAPVPKRMEWTSDRVEARIAQAGIIIRAPGISVGTDVGLIRSAMLYPAYQRSKKNPNGATLKQVLSLPVYERWAELRKIYLGRDGDVDRLRPLYAAKELYDAAVRAVGMTEGDIVSPVVERVAKAHGIPTRSTTVRLVIKDPKATLKQLEGAGLGDVDCMVQTLDRLNSDLSMMVRRANAWADGDVVQLRAMPFVDQKQACKRALMSNEVARQQGIADLDAQVKVRWLAVVRQALSEHDTVFATLPVSRLMEDHGVLDFLRAEGFSVRVPE